MAGEIPLTSMDCDGTRSGFDLALTRAVSDAAGAQGGSPPGGNFAKTWPMENTQGRADAALAAAISSTLASTPWAKPGSMAAASPCATEAQGGGGLAFARRGQRTRSMPRG